MRQSPAAGRPGWADLPADLWRHIMLAAADRSLQRLTPPEVLTAEPWAAWRSLISTMAAVCRSLRDAVSGRDADILWDKPRFRACYPGLSQQQSHSLTALQLRRCRDICPLHSVFIWGGGWETAELHEVCSTLPRLVDILDLANMHVAAEAAVIGGALAGASAITVLYRGSTPVAFPRKCQRLIVQDSFLSNPTDVDTKTLADALLAQVLQLGALRVLTFHTCAYLLTAQDVRLIKQRLPFLQRLCLTLHSWHTEKGPSQVAVQALKLLPPTVQLDLCLWPRDSTCSLHVLRQLHGLHLLQLQVMVLSGGLSPAEEALLARCCDCSCKRLMLCFRGTARRLRVEPAGVNLVYGRI